MSNYKIKTEAIILKRRDMSEKSQVVFFLSPTLGRGELAVRGSKKLTGRFMGKLESFNHVNLFLTKGSGLDILEQIDLIEGFPLIRGDLQRLCSAIYMSDIIYKRVEVGEENRQLFSLFKAGLLLLEKGTESGVVCRFFDIRFISMMGYKPEMKKCVSCGKGEGPGVNLKTGAGGFDYSMGGILCYNCYNNLKNKEYVRGFAPGTLKTLEFLLKSPFALIERLKPSEDTLKEMNLLLKEYYLYRLPGSAPDDNCYQAIWG